MVRRGGLRTLAVVGAAAAGAGVGWLAERRALQHARSSADPEWAELNRGVPARTQVVTADDGTRLHVEVVGPEHAPALVFAHGYGLSQRSWHYQRRDLSSQFRVVSYDQRGHGGSGKAATGDYSIQALGRDLQAVLEACVPDGRAILVGHSMGGMAIMAWAEQLGAEVPARAAGAVLIATSPTDVVAGVLGAVPRAVATAIASLAPRMVAFRGPAGERPSDVSYLVTRFFGLTPQASPAHVAFTERLVLECPGEVRAALIPALTTAALDHGVEALTVPTLVVVGERDRLTPAWQSRRLAQALPDGHLVELPGVGHMAPLEAHEIVTAHVRRFADRARRAA